MRKAEIYPARPQIDQAHQNNQETESSSAKCSQWDSKNAVENSTQISIQLNSSGLSLSVQFISSYGTSEWCNDNRWK